MNSLKRDLMNDKDKSCPFVSEEGCTVYDDRPWPCRMYPLDVNNDGTFSLITDVSHCLGLKEDHTLKLSDWLRDQSIEPYEEMNEYLSSLTIQLQTQKLDIDNPKIYQMVFMALYNLDKFKDFIFKSTFLERFEVDSIRVIKIQRSDEELLKFAFDWIKFGIFGQMLFKVKEKPEEQ